MAPAAVQTRPIRISAKQALRALAARSTFLRRAVAGTPPATPNLAAGLDRPELQRYVPSAPHPQNAVDIFRGEWSSKLPPEIGVQSGEFLLFDDLRLRWALGQIGGVAGKDVLELGPLEGGHTYMLEHAGARHVTAIEANVRAFLKCLVVKEIARLKAAEFLCGDFVTFLKQNLEQNQRTFDVVLACGVLYHMTEPLRFLHMLSRTAPNLVIFTHYYDEALIRGNARTTAQFNGVVEAEAGGYSCRLHRQQYPQVAREGLSFSGGSQTFSYWMPKDDILNALRHFGYTRVEAAHDVPDHPNGPGFSLIACR